MKKTGRIIIHTGDGKGKTTAALGTVFRALGHGQKVCVVQFIKGQGKYGERIFAEKLDNLDWHICGKGFVFNKEQIDEDKKVAEEGFRLAAEIIASDRYDLVVLDELTYLPTLGFLPVELIVTTLKAKPRRLSIVISGRNAPSELVELADTVSAISVVKHAYQQGIKAQKGIEF
jgi:cob(I)alamin adenosyltransferase